MMTLLDLQKNQSAKILSCPNKRLCDLGIGYGIEVRMIQEGNPCIVCLDGTRFAIGVDYQKVIRVKRNNDGNNPS